MMRMISAAIVVGPGKPGIGCPGEFTGLALMAMPRVVVQAGEEDIVRSRARIARFLDRKTVLYWH